MMHKQQIEDISRSVASQVSVSEEYPGTYNVTVFALTVTERELLSAAIAELDFIIDNLPFEEYSTKQRLSRVYDQLRKVSE